MDWYAVCCDEFGVWCLLHVVGGSASIVAKFVGEIPATRFAKWVEAPPEEETEEADNDLGDSEYRAGVQAGIEAVKKAFNGRNSCDHSQRFILDTCDDVLRGMLGDDEEEEPDANPEAAESDPGFAL